MKTLFAPPYAGFSQMMSQKYLRKNISVLLFTFATFSCDTGACISYLQDGVQPEHSTGISRVRYQGNLAPRVYTQVLPRQHVT